MLNRPARQPRRLRHYLSFPPLNPFDPLITQLQNYVLYGPCQFLLEFFASVLYVKNILKLLLIALLSHVFCSPVPAADSNLDLLSRLEYDQEIKGLKIPAHWIPDLKEDLFIGRASIQPSQSKLWSIGWKPALKLENVTFNGSLNDLGAMFAKISRSARTSITIEHLSTTDHQNSSIILIAENGNWRQLTP